MRKPVFGVSDRSDTNQAEQPHKMARGLTFRMLEVEGLYYPYSKADLRLCIRTCICKSRFSHDAAQMMAAEAIRPGHNIYFKKFVIVQKKYWTISF